MKATNLIIGQKYNWVRNDKPSYEVEYIGTDYCGSVLVYVFQYFKNDGKCYAELPVVHCEREIFYTNESRQAVVKNANKERENIAFELSFFGLRLVCNSIFKGEYPYSKYVGKLDDYKQIILDHSL